MVPVLKKLKAWTLYVHIVTQINHRGLWVKVETNYLRDSNLIPRHSFLLRDIFHLKTKSVLLCNLRSFNNS